MLDTTVSDPFLQLFWKNDPHKTLEQLTTIDLCLAEHISEITMTQGAS